MIAITLGLMILAGMLTVFVNTSATRNEIDRTNRQIENGRYAMELLRDDIQLAGFFGEIDMTTLATAYDLTALGIPVPDPCSTVLLERTQLTPVSPESPGLLQVHVQGINNYAALACFVANGINIKLGTDVIIVRRVKTCSAGVGDCDTLAYLTSGGGGSGKPALQVSLCAKPTAAQVSASTITSHALALYPNAGEFKHLENIALGSPPGTNCTVAAQLRPYVIYMYFVGTDDVLKRAEFVNGTGMSNVTALVDGIENLQLEYGVDTTVPGDGNADTYTASPATVAAWTNVVSVQVNLLARNTEVSPDYKGSALEASKTYNLGPSAGSVGPFTDGLRRHVYSARVRIQNVSQRRELP